MGWGLLTRFAVCWVLVLVAWKVKENYPFSNNPMYARWEPATYVLYTTDEADDVLFFETEFGQTAVKLKKIVKTWDKQLKKENPALNDEAALRQAGLKAMQHYHENRSPKTTEPRSYRELKLWRADLTLQDGEVKRTDSVLAVFTPGGES